MHQGPKFRDAPPPGPPPVDQSDPNAAFFKIGFIERSQRKIFAAVFSEYGLHPPGRSQRELADDLRIERATVTVTLQKLERGGFIRREADPDDQRVMRIYPTEKGINAVNNITVELQRFHEACAKSLTDEQRQQLLELLQKLENTVVDYLQGLNRPD